MSKLAPCLSTAIATLWLCTLSACAGTDAGAPAQVAESAPAPAAMLEVYRNTGARQCEGGGRTLAELQGELESAGIKVLEAACGSDGRMYASVCGGADGAIGIFRIKAEQTEAAAKAGFAALATLPDAQRVPCP